MKGGGGGDTSGVGTGFGAVGTVISKTTQPISSFVKGHDADKFGAGGGSGKTSNDFMLFKST